MRKLLDLGLGATVAIISIFVMLNERVTASPAPVFRPILEDIQNRLPQGMIMRLPSSVDYLPFPVYPSVAMREDGLIVALSSQSDCQARACQRGYLGVFKQNTNNAHINYLVVSD